MIDLIRLSVALIAAALVGASLGAWLALPSNPADRGAWPDEDKCKVCPYNPHNNDDTTLQ